jgi:uncharacterized coiled-coil protein SlyX
VINVYATGPNIALLQIAKHREEISRLQDKMRAAVQDASKELQAKETRIQRLEKKVC